MKKREVDDKLELESRKIKVSEGGDDASPV